MSFVSSLATEDQIATEKVILRLLEHPEVRVARGRMLEIMEASPLAKFPDGKDRMDYVVDAWLTFLAFSMANEDTARPRAIWSHCNSSYTWFDHTMPANGAVLDCPDNVYRMVPIDSESRYEIRGRMRPMHPAQFSFMLIRDDDMQPRSGADNAPLGLLTSQDLKIAADGTFLVTIDPDPANGRVNHLQTRPGSLIRLLIRDTTAHWLQSANELTVHRVAGPEPGPLRTEDEIATQLAARFPQWASGWLKYVSNLHGPPPENTITRIMGRAGAWGYFAFARFNLSEDDAIVFTIDDGACEYAGGQITDVWGIMPDPQLHLSSYTTRQARMNADGTHTFVIAPRDPGVPNWIETGGMHRGWLMFRWQGVPKTRTSGDGLVRKFQLAKASDLSSFLPEAGMDVTSEQRTRQRLERQIEWRTRIAEGA
jgi:hypothetical protein